MDKRQTLQSELEAILGSRNVYYQPPANLKMQYPAIRYKKQKIISLNEEIDSLNANVADLK